MSQRIQVARKSVSFVGPRTGANWTVTLEAYVKRHGPGQWRWYLDALGRSEILVDDGGATSKTDAIESAKAALERAAADPTGAMEDAA